MSSEGEAPYRGSVLVTGAGGFIGRNLCARLRTRPGVQLFEYRRTNPPAQLDAWAVSADTIFHFAGSNRPETRDGFDVDNIQLTRRLTAALRRAGSKPHIVFSSSVQAERDNDYGRSKRAAEDVLAAFSRETGVPVTVFRVKNVFGKWSRPNYNSVVATFCHNAARDLPLEVHDPARELELVYIDDVVDVLLSTLESKPPGGFTVARDCMPSYCATLGEIADTIRAFRAIRDTLVVPEMSQRFNRLLLATYMSHVDSADWEYALDRKSDDRGDLAEVLKSSCFGQIFVSRTHPGITRGNHYHHSKVEKFLVLSSEGLIRFRHIEGGDVLHFRVRGEEYRIVEIPPGYTHSITNVGDTDMITLFWANEIFDSARPDTHMARIDSARGQP